MKGKKNTKEKLLIIDGNALIHRGFHALPPTMTTKDGEMVNAVYGFTSVLLKAISELKPQYVVLTLDKKGPTFRHKEYKEYKAHRKKPPDELYMQIPKVKSVAKVFDIPIYEQTGYEADDLIGTICTSVNDDVEKIILTGDLDLLQLVNDHVRVYTMQRGFSDNIIYDSSLVFSRYGLTPDQMIDYKALRGDPSDNIPGVRGVGEKTATSLLKIFKTLDNLYLFLEGGEKKLDKKMISHPDLEKTLKPRIKDLLVLHKQDAFMSRSLATIKLDVNINFDLEDTKFGTYDQADIISLFSDFEFKSLILKVKDLVSGDGQKTEVDKFARNKNDFKYHLVNNDKDFKRFLAKLKGQKHFTFDAETSDFNTMDCDLLGISFAWSEGEAYYVNIGVEKKKQKKVAVSLFGDVSHNNYLDQLKPIFEDEKVKKFAHNMKFDTKVMESFGIHTKGLDFDTMLASYLLNPGSRQHNLDTLTFSELGFEKITKDDLLGVGRSRITFSEVELEKLMLYSCEDADFTNRLVKKLKGKLKEDEQDRLLKKIEMPLISVLAKMENNGIKIDEKFLGKLGKKADVKIKKIQKNIWKLAGSEFNIRSTKQLREILFEKLKISTEGISKTKTGFSTAADELEKLRDEHDIIPLIQEFRELAKLTSTYIDALPRLINPKTGRIHSSFNQAVTATGRLSSTEPNLQNIPVRTEMGQEIRKAFVTPTTHKLVSLDYSQIELRLAAHMSGDTKMIKAFKNGVDIHSATAAEINEVPLDKVDSGIRREAKAINFGILYGQGPYGLSQVAGISFASAKHFINKYFFVYKGVKKFLESTVESARELGYVETLFGRRRYLPEINSSMAQVKNAAERMAVNAPLQGTAADMIKIAMTQVDKYIRENYQDDEIKMVLQVHDELVFEIKNSLVEKISEDIKKIMEGVLKLSVPVVVDTKVGNNWGEME